MHWSVGMLLHDVCVLFYRGVKNRIVENRMRGGQALPNIFFLSFYFFFCQHGAVDPDDIPFMPILDLNTFFFWYNHYPCFHAKQMVRSNPILSYYGSAIKLLSLFAVIIFPYTYVYRYMHMYV